MAKQMIFLTQKTKRNMKLVQEVVKLKTKSFCHFVDLTDKIQRMISNSKIKNGFVVTYSKHTTMAIRINEKENGIVKDFKAFMKKVLPNDSYYHHNDLTVRTENLVCEPGATDCLNGHSHCAHLILGTSETIPIVNGKLLLGRWQRIFAIELDVARKREVYIQIMGE